MISLGQYVPGDTIIHHLDPRVKILAVVLMSPLIIAAPAAGIGLITCFLASILAAARLSLSRTAAALKPVALFITAIFLMHLFLTEGRPLLSLAPLPVQVTWDGLLQGMYVSWQFASLVIAAAILTMTTLPSELVSGIERLLRPLRHVGVPSQDIALMISLALRFVPTLLEEYERLRMAQMARGADFTAGPLARRMRAVALFAIPLLLSAFRRAEELAMAMEARGYHRGPRTTLRELRLGPADMTALGVMILFALLYVALRMIP